ncbi:hypothetical protein TELCIR_26286 [Teladorsagia circumcincta]|uniref:Uncharacterized protein n=1 Tax=Teladorsagia circumcincta TaxID=45464 RepID=A0A2G9T3D9_TELCI|nr:hypothetical protein TELCIR_26286 [Teladorsagia circumcincta]
MRIAVVTCKVKPPSADQLEVDVESSSRRVPPVPPPHDDFLRELIQLAAFHGKTRQEVLDVVDSLSDEYFTRKMNNLAFTETTPPPTVISPRPSVQSSYTPSSQLPSPNGPTTPIPYSNVYHKFEYV